MHVPMSVWYVAGLLLLSVISRPLLALVYGRRIGEKVVANQKSVIHLVAATASDSARAGELEASSQRLQALGFADAGWFAITEMPDLVLRMHAHEPEGWLAVLYDHARADSAWLEMNCRFPDGSRLSFTDQRSSGLSALPGVECHHLPGATPESMLRAARDARSKRDLTPLAISTSTAQRVFEEGYAELVALRKQQGISRAEVVAVSMRKPLARPGKVA